MARFAAGEDATPSLCRYGSSAPCEPFSVTLGKLCCGGHTIQATCRLGPPSQRSLVNFSREKLPVDTTRQKRDRARALLFHRGRCRFAANRRIRAQSRSCHSAHASPIARCKISCAGRDPPRSWNEAARIGESGGLGRRPAVRARASWKETRLTGWDAAPRHFPFVRSAAAAWQRPACCIVDPRGPCSGERSPAPILRQLCSRNA